MITLDRKILTEAFSLVGACVPSKTTKEVLRNVHVRHDGNRLALTGSDGEVHIRTQLTCEADPFECLVPASRVITILDTVPHESIQLEVASDHVLIEAGSSSFRLGTQDPKDFPQIPLDEDPEVTRVTGSELKRMVTRTKFCIDMESTRYALGGVFFEIDHGQLTLASTDSRRLSVDHCLAGTHDTHVGRSFVVPAGAIMLLGKAVEDGEVWIRVHENDVSFQSGDTMVSCQLVQGRFPPWRKVVPTEFNGKVNLVAKSWLSLVRQAAITVNEESRGIHHAFISNQLLVESEAKDIGRAKARIPLSYDGPAMSLSLDHKYLAQYLAVAGDACLELGLIATDDRIMMTIGDWRHVIMPLSREETPEPAAKPQGK